MEKLMVFVALLTIFYNESIAQVLSDDEAIFQTLKGINIDGKFTWRPKDKRLKSLVITYLQDDNIEVSKKGLKLISYILTGDEYDNFYDSLFLNILISKLEIDSVFENTAFLKNHFLRSDYNASSIRKLNYYCKPQSLLYWKDWTPYYLSVLNLEGLDLTLTFLKENIDAINELHFRLYNIPFRYDTSEINICLSRIGKLSDTIVIDNLTSEIETQPNLDYKWYIENLARIRSQYSFQKIGDLLLSDFENLKYDDQRTLVRQMALAALLAYVKNFPNRSTKYQDVFNLWSMVEYSKTHVKDYSTDEYMEIAKAWYRKNRKNLILDYEKY